ncbi:MAG: AMP-binding protein [Acidimicrobiales bacterium]
MAAAHGDRMALTDATGSVTWSELDERVNRLVDALRNRGLRPGATVVVLAGNQRQVVEVILACMHGGWLVVPVNRHWVADELAYVLDDTDAQAVVVGEPYVEVASAAIAVADHRPDLRVVIGSEPHDGFEGYDDVVASGSPSEIADPRFGGPMFYTSGTTGRPKAVRSRLNDLSSPVEAWRTIGEGIGAGVGVTGPGSVLLLTGPIYHSVQWVYTFGTLLNGSAVIIEPAFDPAQVLLDIDRHGATHVHLVPTQMVRLLRLDDEQRAAFDGSSLRRVFHGAAACPEWVKRAMIEWWGPVITEYYGGTEAGFLTSISSAEWLEHPGSVGRPGPNVELTIVDDAGAPLPARTPGLIHFRNLAGHDFEYHNAAEKTAKAHPAAGVGTLGDVGWVDEDGYLYLSDRQVDMIVSGGVNIYPAEVERALGEHPLVADLAVVGVPDEEMGESVAAMIETVGNVPLDADLIAELDAFCRSRIAGYKRPRTWRAIDRLPRNEIGKVSKHQVRELLKG